MLNKFLSNKNIFKLITFFLLASWLHQWISLGTFVRLELPNLNFDIKSILNKRNLSIFLLPINLILFCVLNKKKNFILILFFFISLGYLIGTINYEDNLVISEKEKLEIINFHENELFSSLYKNFLEEMLSPIIGMFLTILILLNLYSINATNGKELIIKTNLILLFIIVFLVFFQKGNLNTNPVYTLDIFGRLKTITSNGISRSLIILFIFLLCKLTIDKNKFYYVQIFICGLCSYLVISNEGRLNFISLFLAIFFILSISKITLIKKILVFFLIFITPIIISALVKLQEANNSQLNNIKIDSKKNIILKLDDEIVDKTSLIEEITKLNLGKVIIKDNSKEILIIAENEENSIKLVDKVSDELNLNKDKNIIATLKKNRLFKLQGEKRNLETNKPSTQSSVINFGGSLHEKCNDVYANITNTIIINLNTLTTGRIKKWLCAFNLSNKDLIGNGPEQDRRLLVRGANPFIKQGEDVANAAIYTFLAGGLFSLTFFLIIIFKYFKMCFEFLILKKNYYLKENYLFVGSLITSGYLIGRGFFENSFASYSIDYLILISCLTFIFLEFNNLKKTH
jgi:hypothetical protein